jgi:hypothetical protein
LRLTLSNAVSWELAAADAEASVILMLRRIAKMTSVEVVSLNIMHKLIFLKTFRGYGTQYGQDESRNAYKASAVLGV